MANAAQAAWLAQQGDATARMNGADGGLDGASATLATAAAGAHTSGATLGSAHADLRAASFVYFAPVAATVAPVAPRWREVAREATAEQASQALHDIPQAPHVAEAAQVGRVGERTDERGVTATLIRATALVAQVLGRAPEDVWAEALENWLASQEQSQQQGRDGVQFIQSGAAPRARLVEVRRQENWQTIDATLHALRVS
ncbi:MAG: hypothetical protein ABI068_16475 [Ktedonobacterales bacterium]